jgi:Phage integrase family
MGKTSLLALPPGTENGTVDDRVVPFSGRRRPRRPKNVEVRPRGEFLTQAEVELLIKAVGKNRNAHRDASMILVASRHGLRVSELIDLRWEQIDFNRAEMHIRRAKKGSPATHPIPGYAGCGACNANSVRRRHLFSLRNVGRLSAVVVCIRWWRRQASLLVCPFQSIRTCYVTPPGLSLPTMALPRTPFRHTSGTATFSTPYATLSCRQASSKICGTIDGRPARGEKIEPITVPL